VIVTEPWWIFDGALDKRSCDSIVELGLLSKRERGVGRTSELEEERVTQVAWLRDPWVYELVEPWVYRANEEAGWNFDVELMQSLQFGIYPVGGRYDWHLDQTGRVYDQKDDVAPSFHGLIRKISFSLQLSEPSDYEGGDLEIEAGIPSDAKRVEVPDPDRKRGTLVVFPSFYPHRVTPVTRGTRYSLVSWLCGKPWR